MAQPPAFLVSLPSQVDATDGDIVTFQVRVTGEPKPTVTWYRCGEAVNQVTGRWDLVIHDDGWHELLVTNLNVEDEGEYECRAENMYGQASTFGDLYYYGPGHGTKQGYEGIGRMDEDDGGPQSGLMILIDDGSQTDEDEDDDPSRRRSLTASEQMQGIIEDLTSEDSLTLCRDEFGSNDPSEHTLIFEDWHHSNTNPSTPPHLQTMSEGRYYPAGSPRMTSVHSPDCFSCPVSDMTSWYPQSGQDTSYGELSSDNVSSISTLEGDQMVVASGDVSPQTDPWQESRTSRSDDGSHKGKGQRQCWDIVEEEEDQTVPQLTTKPAVGESSGVNPPAMSYSRSSSSYKSSSSSYKYSEGVSDESIGRSSISSSTARTSRLERLDSSDLLTSSLRRTSGRMSIDDDDSSSILRRGSRTSSGVGAIDDDDFSTRRTMRRLEDDIDSGVSSLRRTTRLSSRDDDDFSTSSLMRRSLATRLSTDDDSPTKRVSSTSSATHEDESDEKRSVRRSTRSSTMDEEDEGYSLRKSKLTSSLDVDDESSSLSVRANRSATSFEGEEAGMKIKSTRNVLNYSESFSSETKVSDMESLNQLMENM